MTGARCVTTGNGESTMNSSRSEAKNTLLCSVYDGVEYYAVDTFFMRWTAVQQIKLWLVENFGANGGGLWRMDDDGTFMLLLTEEVHTLTLLRWGNEL
jgi:hypothetical protein